MASSMPDAVDTWIEYEKVLNITIPKQTEEQKQSSWPAGVQTWVSYDSVIYITLPSKETMREIWNIQDMSRKRKDIKNGAE